MVSLLAPPPPPHFSLFTMTQWNDEIFKIYSIDDDCYSGEENVYFI